MGRLEERLRLERRTPRDLFGQEAGDEVARRFGETIATTNQSVVESFVRSRAVEKIVGALLYDTLVEFVQRSNLLGRFIKQLPVIGPIQMQIEATLKFFVDQQLADVIKSFLGEYASTATERILQLASTPQNRRDLGDFAGRALANQVLSRPVSELMPDQAAADALKRSAAEFLLPVSGAGAGAALVDLLYDGLGDERLGDLLSHGGPAPRVGDGGAARLAPGAAAAPPPQPAPGFGPRARAALVEGWQRFVGSPDGQEALVATVAAALGTRLPPRRSGSPADRL